MENMAEWVDAVVKRLSAALPYRPQNLIWTSIQEQVLKQTIECIVELSQKEFSSVMTSLSSLLQELIKSFPPASANEKEVESFCSVLCCLESCFAKRRDSTLDDEDLHALQQLYQRITQLSLLQGEHTEKLSTAANSVLYHLSGLHFHGIFNKIILRVTSVNRVTLQSGASSDSNSSTDQFCVIGLIQHLNLNAARLQQILQVIVTSFKDLKKHKQLFISLPPILHKSIWNFIQEYPSQFNELLNNGFPSLERSAEKLFNLCDEYADNQRKKIQIWPFQNTVLILCPKILKDITESGIDKSSPKHKSQRNFITAIMKGLTSGNKQLCEAATVCAVDLFKAGSFVRDRINSFFRYFVTQIQGQLHNLLFSPQNPFLHQVSSAQASIPTFGDRELMVTCLVAQFRTNHRNSHIFSICLDSGSPTVFRLAFVEGLYIVLKEKSLSWWPTNEAVYLYTQNLRRIFQSVLSDLRRYDTSQHSSPQLICDVRAYLQSPTTAANMLQAKNRAERKQMVEMITNYQLMQGLIRLFTLDPLLAFSPLKGDRDRIGECLQFMTGLVSLVQHHSLPHIPIQANEVLLLLHQPENIELWDKNDPMTAFWDISGQVTYSIALKLFSRKTLNPIQLLRWLKQILQYRTQFLKKHETEASQGITCKISQQMYTMLETVLLLFLRNTNIEGVTIAMSCFKYLCLEAELVMSPSEPSAIPYAPNLRSYHQLEELSQMPAIGRAAHQRKIRAILKGLVHTPGSALAWEDTYSSWRVTKTLLLCYQKTREEPTPQIQDYLRDSFPRHFMRKVNTFTQVAGANTNKDQQLTDDNIQEEMLNWSNMTGFLCSLAGVSTKPSPSSYTLLFLTTSAAASGAMNGPTSAVDDIVSSSQPTYPPSPLKDMSRVKRSSSYHGGRPKSLITAPARGSTSIAPAHHESVVSMSRLAASSDGSLEDGDKNSRTSQTQAFITELMNLLRCDSEAIGVQIRETVKELVSYELSPLVYPYLFQCMMEDSMKVTGTDGQVQIKDNNTALIDQLVSIVQHVLENKAEGASEHLVHVKMDDLVLNLIMYVDSLETSERSLTIKIKICHLIETLMQHARDVSFWAEVQFRNQVARYLTQWITGKVYISENSSHEENLQNDLDLNSLRAVGLVMSGLVLQGKFKTSDILEEKGRLFLKYFTSFMNLIHSLNHVEWNTLSPIQKQPLQRHVASLREYTIRAVSNMLTANIDSGLTHAISLGYHEDLKTRASFMEVLTSILRQGAEFNSLADTALADRYNHMLDLVTTETTDGDFPIMIALVNAVQQENADELAEVLVLLFDFKNKLAPFLLRILGTEVEALETGHLDTLFRGNSIACKVLSCSFKTFGMYYLQSVVRPLILQLMKASDKDYEVDPARLTDTSKLEKNQLNLLNLVKTFYTTIVSSQASLPLQLRTVCHILNGVVCSHSPESSVDTVNSAIFLRFINPAIVSPQSYNLVQGEIPNGVRRGLTLISKVLQNLANHVLFKKEAHMEPFNQFLEENFQRSRELAVNMASMGPCLEGEAGEYIAFLKETYKHRLHSLLWNNQERINAFAATTRTYVSSRHLFHEMNTLLAQLGAPNYRKRGVSADARSTIISSQLEEFLDSMANECDEKTLRSIKAKEIFYQGGVSKAGNPVFYFIVRKFRGDQPNISYQLLYHAMTVLKRSTEKAFELVLDLTQASQMNEPDLELLVKFAAYVPELVVSQIHTVYFYNANMAFKQCANRMANATRIFSHIQGAKRVVMVDSYSRLTDYIEPAELKLPSDTMAFEEDGRLEFNNVHFLMFARVALQIPAVLHVCGCGLVVSLVDRIKVFDMPTTIREVYHISNIREVFCEDKNSLAIRLGEGQLLRCSSVEAETIAKEVSTVISRWQNEQPSRYMSERKLEPKDVPGTFLNMALLNLGSVDPGLRIAAYKLLSAVKDGFRLRIVRHLESTHDLCVPANSAQFVVSVSKELAKNEPHLTLQFLSEVVAGFQQYTPALKQLCLAYISPWLPNLSKFAARSEGQSEQDKVMKLIDLLVALTVSEKEMYPLIQTHVWTNIGGEPELLKKVLTSFIKMGIVEGLGSRKVEVLADSAVTLEQGNEGVVATQVVKWMLKIVAHTSDQVSPSLEKHYLWSELTVLSRFLLALSFGNKINVVKNMADIFYLCVLMMSYGLVFVRATIHGVILNTVQSLASTPEVMSNEEVVSKLSLKLVELSDPKFYMQFGISNPASVSGFLQVTTQSARHQSFSNVGTDSLSSQAVVGVVEHLLDVVVSCQHLFEECNWVKRWQRLARRTSFYYNPALQSRSFLMLGVVTQKASTLLVTKTLKVLEDTMLKHEDDVLLLEAIVISLTMMVPLLDEVCENNKLNQHLFWVSVGILQLGVSTLYAAGLGLMEACIKVLTNVNAFESQNLAAVMQPTRDAMEWPLSQMDREVGLSFSGNFHFALAALLYKGFSHPLSTVRARTQELLTTLFFIHSPKETLSAASIEVNPDNLAYLTALFPESEIMREQLCDRRTRLKSFTLSFSEAKKNEKSLSNYGSLLSVDVISTQKQQILFLLMLASALVQTQDEKKVQLLYDFLEEASTIYTDVFPLIHSVLVDHMGQMLQSTQSTDILMAVQRLITVAVSRNNDSILFKPSHIIDMGFGGLPAFFKPFPKRPPLSSTAQGMLFQKYISSLTHELSPNNGNTDYNPKGSLSKLSSSSSTFSTGSARELTSLVPPPAPLLVRKKSGEGEGGSSSVLVSEVETRISRDASPGSIETLSMDELDLEVVEETML